MPKEVNPRIHVNERDYPIQDHHCDDPIKKKMVMKLARMITDNIPRKLPGAMHENHMDFWILDRLLTNAITSARRKPRRSSTTCCGSVFWNRTGTTKITTSSTACPNG